MALHPAGQAPNTDISFTINTSNIYENGSGSDMQVYKDNHIGVLKVTAKIKSSISSGNNLAIGTVDKIPATAFYGTAFNADNSNVCGRFGLSGKNGGLAFVATTNIQAGSTVFGEVVFYIN